MPTPSRRETLLLSISVWEDWSDANKSADSLDRIFQQAMGFADQAIDWYWRNKRCKKRLASIFRVIVIVLVAGAGIVPIIYQLDNTIVQPLVSTLLLAGAGLFQALDHFLGWSKGWIRYVLTASELMQLKNDFNMQWVSTRAARQGAPPDSDHVTQQIERIRTFVAKRNQIVRRETDQWATDYMSVVKELEQATGKTAEAGKPR